MDEQLVSCECGCGSVFPFTEYSGKIKRFVIGHSSRVNAQNRVNKYQMPPEKRCNRCNLIKPITEFRMLNYKSDFASPRKRPYSQCKNCEYELSTIWNTSKDGQAVKRAYRKRHLGDVRVYIQERISTYRSKKYSKSNLTVELPKSNLTVDYLVNLYYWQHGKCFYSDIDMVFDHKEGKARKDSLSLDRLDPEKGYVIGNVVWCCYYINTAKQNLTLEEFGKCMTIVVKNINKVVMPPVSFLIDKPSKQ